jgi:hypothetical protein
MPFKSESADQPSEWKNAYRSRKQEPVFPAFFGERLRSQIYLGIGLTASFQVFPPMNLMNFYGLRESFWFESALI